MNLLEVRSQLAATRESAMREAEAFKDPWIISERLVAAYRQLGPAQRDFANQVLVEWVRSDDEDMRFDAIVMIEKNGVYSARDALLELRKQLAGSSRHSAPFELQMVDDALMGLGTKSIG